MTIDTDDRQFAETRCEESDNNIALGMGIQKQRDGK